MTSLTGELTPSSSSFPTNCESVDRVVKSRTSSTSPTKRSSLPSVASAVTAVPLERSKEGAIAESV